MDDTKALAKLFIEYKRLEDKGVSKEEISDGLNVSLTTLKQLNLQRSKGGLQPTLTDIVPVLALIKSHNAGVPMVAIDGKKVTQTTLAKWFNISQSAISQKICTVLKSELPSFYIAKKMFDFQQKKLKEAGIQALQESIYEYSTKPVPTPEETAKEFFTGLTCDSTGVSQSVKDYLKEVEDEMFAACENYYSQEFYNLVTEASCTMLDFIGSVLNILISGTYEKDGKVYDPPIVALTSPEVRDKLNDKLQRFIQSFVSDPHDPNRTMPVDRLLEVVQADDTKKAIQMELERKKNNKKQ